jgi:hypothetical protein
VLCESRCGRTFSRPNQSLPSRKNHNRAHVQNQDLGEPLTVQGLGGLLVSGCVVGRMAVE